MGKISKQVWKPKGLRGRKCHAAGKKETKQGEVQGGETRNSSVETEGTRTKAGTARTSHGKKQPRHREEIGGRVDGKKSKQLRRDLEKTATATRGEVKTATLNSFEPQEGK